MSEKEKSNKFSEGGGVNPSGRFGKSGGFGR